MHVLTPKVVSLRQLCQIAPFVLMMETNTDSPTGSSQWLIPSLISSSMEGPESYIVQNSILASPSSSRRYHPTDGTILKLCQKEPSPPGKHVFAFNGKG